MRRGFTLVELLVVIGIIAILAAMLMPVFARAREKGRQAECLSNQRQLATAILMYVDDNEEKMPPARGWSETIAPYADDDGMFDCPTGRERGTAARPEYLYNNGVAGFALASLGNLTRHHLTVDGAHVATPAPPAPPPVPATYDYVWYTRDDLRPRHDGKVICSFADGHAETQINPLPSRSVITGIPVVEQGYNECGLAALAMVMNYWGDPVTVEEMKGPTHFDPNEVPLSAEIAHFPLTRGFQELLRKDGAGTLDELLDNVTRRRPGIVFQFANEQAKATHLSGHYRVVFGYDYGAHLIYTRSDSPKGWVTHKINTFISLWDRTGGVDPDVNWMVVLRK